MSSADPYIIIPMDRYTHLQNKVHEIMKQHEIKPVGSPVVESTKEQPEQSSSSEEENETGGARGAEGVGDDVMPRSPERTVSLAPYEPPATKISNETKTLIKKGKLHSRVLEKFIHAVQSHNAGEAPFENLKDLVKAATSQTTKTYPNEEAFYMFLQKHRLMHFVKNRK